MLGPHTAAGSTIDPVKAHTYKLTLNVLSQTCVCVCVGSRFFPPFPKSGFTKTICFPRASYIIELSGEDLSRNQQTIHKHMAN